LEKVKTSESSRLLEFALVFIVAIAFSSFTLWLIDSYLRYVLFVFETIVIIALFLTINQYHIKLNFWRSTIKLRQFSLIPDFSLIFGSLILFLLELFNINGGLIQLCLSLILTAFLCGYGFLNILGMHSHFSRLELFVLSYVASFLLSGFVFLCFLPFSQMVRTILLCSVFMLIGLLSMAKHFTSNGETLRKSFSRSQDLLIISLAITFYLIIFFSMYPQTGLIMGNDIVAHSVFSTILSRTPAFYVWSNYMLHNAFEASFLSLSGSFVDLLFFQSALASLMVMLPIAFYITAKEYLEHIDKRLPSLATLFWCLFQAGYGWIYFTILKINSNSLSQFELLLQTSGKTYFSTTYGLFGNYFLPESVVFIMVLFLLFLLKRENMPSSKFIVLFSLIVAAMFLTHIAEATFFVMFIVFWGLISKNKPTTIGRALKASLIGFLIVLITYIGVGQIIIIFWVPELEIAIILPILLIAASIILRRSFRWWNLTSFIKAKISGRHVKSSIVLMIVFLYFLALLIIPYALPSFATPLIMNIFSVPWFFYPLILGVTGSLCLIGLIFIIRYEKLYSALSVILAFALFTFVSARAISFTNANLFYTSFYENRFIVYLLLASSLIAPIAILKFASRLDCSFRKRTQKMIVSILLIGLLVVSGASTTFLNIEYCSVVDAQYKPSMAEIEALNYLHNVFNKDPAAFLVTITAESQVNTRFASPIVTYASLYTYAGYGPEITLPYLYVNPAFSHGYLYMDLRDFEALNSGGYNNRFLAQHLIPILPVIFENSEVTIYNISRIAPPVPLSNQILLLQSNMSSSVNDETLFCYDMLSLGLYNYTTAFDTDNDIMRASSLLLSFDPKEGNIYGPSIEDYTKFVDSGGNLIILNTDGFGTFAKMFFQPSNGTYEADHISNILENLTLPKGIVIPKIESINETAQTLSSFVSFNETSPYITKMNIGEGQLFYVNVEPLIKYMNQPDGNKSEIYSIIGKLLNDIKLQPLDSRYEFLSLRALMPESTGYTKEIHLDNAVSINTSSLLFSSYPDLAGDGYKEIRVTNSNGISLFYNVTSIQLSNYSNIVIQSSDATIVNGKSFYTQLNLNESIELDFTSNASLSVTKNHEQFQMINVSSILISADNPITLWARAPTISANSGTFKEIYNLKGIMGGDLVVRGGVTFSITLSDSYSFLSNFQINGSYAGPKASYYDEILPLRFAVVPASIFVVILICILLSVWLIRRKHKKDIL